jgi:molybdate transport system substrate-binding protein
MMTMDIKKIVLVTLVCVLVAVAVLVWASAGQAATTLLVHAGAGIRPPLDELGRAFTKETGVRVDYSYKGSGCLLADICFSKKGDVYIPGEVFYVDQAKQRGFIEESKVVAQMATVIIVQKGNPKNIKGLKDLTKSGMRVGIGDPDAVAVGRAAKQVLVKSKLLKQVEKNIASRALNVVELGIGVKLKHLDAAFVWDATAHLFTGDVEMVEIPDEWRVDCPIPVAVLNLSSHQREAERYMNFLATEEAQKVFVRHGYGLPPKATQDEKQG